MAVRDVSLLILYTATAQILLQHRTHDAFTLPNHWAFFGGGIEAGETPVEALQREALEELAYAVQNPHLLLKQTVRDGQDLNMKYVFLEQYQDEPLRLGEGQAMGWFFPDDTHGLKMIDHDRVIVERIREYLNKL
jgi:8-oxo-dGTP pyrophosphatase MutT (NUDIX family)